MITPSQRDPLAQRWRRLEDAVERLHLAARRSTSATTFYEHLLAEAVQVLDADDVAVWVANEQAGWQIAAQCGARLDVPGDLRQQVAATLEPATARVASGPIVLFPVADVALDAESSVPASAAAVICLGGRSPEDELTATESQQLTATLAEVASDFHAFDRLRRLQHGQQLSGQVNQILRRLCQAADLDAAARVLANEGRLALGCDRLSVLWGEGRRWRLAAASGVDRVERQTDFRSDVESLAAQTATWGEPLELSDGLSATLDDLPPRLAEAASRHFDHSHARRLCCVPFRVPSKGAGKAGGGSHGLALLAEDFTDDRVAALRGPLVELGEGCMPALANAHRWSRLPARWALGWSDRLARWNLRAGWGRRVLTLAVLGAVVASLVGIRVPYEVEAPATLQPVERQHVFATATGTVAEVRVRHGETVAAGAILAVLEDPTLALERQAVAGELATVRERLAAIAATRTERTNRAERGEARLPLSAEAQQLAEREAALLAQRALLDRRAESLTLKSPQRGQVLTLDVQSLLETRPVERGQQLFTIADVEGRWALEAEVDQRDLREVLAAQHTADGCPVRYRLTGEPGRDYEGVLQQVAATAVLDAERLSQGPGPVEATILADGPLSPAARPGMSATVRIDCGARALGYVWFHEAWETIHRWFTF